MQIFLLDIHPLRGLVIEKALDVDAIDGLLDGYGGYSAKAAFDSRVALRKVGVRVLVEGRLRGTVEAPCKRCLETVEYDVDAEAHSTFTPRGKWEHLDQEEIELEAAELDLLRYENDAIDVTPWLRETLLLELESAVICKNDCLGLCPHCGVNRNLNPCTCADEVIDPRWESLLALKQKKKSTR